MAKPLTIPLEGLGVEAAVLFTGSAQGKSFYACASGNLRSLISAASSTNASSTLTVF